MFKLNFLMALCFFISCSKKSNEVITTSTLLMDCVIGTNATTKSIPIDLNVKWFYSSGCDVFDNLTSTSNGNIIIIKAFGYINNTIYT